MKERIKGRNDLKPGAIWYHREKVWTLESVTKNGWRTWSRYERKN